MKTIESLQAERIKIDIEIAKCKAAIREMVGDAKTKRRFAPVKQFNEIQLKAKRLWQESQNIQHEIGAINRVRKASEQQALSQCFVAASKAVLPHEQFIALLNMAKEMANVATLTSQPSQ
jgi:hypothetical protein